MNENEIRILILRSHIGGKKCWIELAKNWNKYGKYKIVTISMINSPFSYNDLIRIMPDIIICSDTAGSPSYFTVDESFSLKQFITKIPCRGIIGTYACFYHTEGFGNSLRIFDNRQIAPLFGISDDLIFISSKLNDNILYTNYSSSYLYQNIGNSHKISGYQSSKTPKIGTWLKDNKIIGLLPNASLLYHTLDYKSIIVYYHHKHYHSLYISSMPEFSSQRTSSDFHLIYHCIVSLFLQSKQSPLLSLSLKSISDHPTILYDQLITNRSLEKLPPYLQSKVLSILNGQIHFNNDDIIYLSSFNFPFLKQPFQIGSPHHSTSSLLI
ncbi:hypothetical protein EDI_020510 [Entamoeba dispar SAW760]|uniref:Uncharacterized protein n=1 Tax=Entamoeba dispar (strain ATCC PRA-260 / SAW760) TaxID=370354 RepID=B0EU08_ENTDS|nr:uncharacterized protein EDI_020510 [Entamoeba dispar SAW760]EDR21977.1 hypothetical protein EDI_020510 [Entamoeba dispar SAW760]|eukprot:EDR21977.1 hypothetical protein EDI_020510 [Entamoeba dispar SAW760]